MDLNPISLQVKGKLIQLQKSLDTKFKELKGKIEATNTDLKGKIANVNADLQGKIDAGDEELKKNISSIIPNFSTFVDGKYMIQKHMINLRLLLTVSVCTKRRYKYHTKTKLLHKRKLVILS